MRCSLCSASARTKSVAPSDVTSMPAPLAAARNALSASELANALIPDLDFARAARSMAAAGTDPGWHTSSMRSIASPFARCANKFDPFGSSGVNSAVPFMILLMRDA